MLKCTQSSVIYKYIDEEADHKTSGSIQLLKPLKRDTRWVEAVAVGPESTIKPGERLLVAFTVVSYKFEFEGTLYAHTSDKAILLVQGLNGQYRGTCGTFLYEWIEAPEETTESGLILIKKMSTKEMEPRWARVFSAGPKSECISGEEVLLAFKNDAYFIELEDKELHNAGVEEIICIRAAKE